MKKAGKGLFWVWTRHKSCLQRNKIPRYLEMQSANGWLCLFPQAPVTNDHKPVSFQQQKFMRSQFLQLQIWNQGVGRTSLWRPWWQVRSMCLSWQGSWPSWRSLVCNCVTPVCFHPCMCLCLLIKMPVFGSRLIVIQCTCMLGCYLTLYEPRDCNPLGFSVHGISQARVLEWAAISFSRGSSWPRDRTLVSCIAGRFLYCLRHQGSPIIWCEGIIINYIWKDPISK